GVGQLNLAARAALLRLQQVEDFRLQDIAARDRHGRGRRALGGLFDHALHAVAAAVVGGGVDDAVFVGVGLGHGLYADDVAADLGVELGQLFQSARLRVHDHVRQDDGEGFMADDVAGAP